MGYTFVSYSRKQLYFAEAITLHLQKQGIESWFDLQQLGAGMDWAATLKAGYGNCDRLVLVASQTALASPYVEVEWDTALKNGREVILAVVEDVSIPEKLRGCPTFDFRSGFNGPMKRLASYLIGQAPARHDPIQPPGRFPYQWRVPVMIWVSLTALILPYLLNLILSLTGLRFISATYGTGTAAFLVIGTLVVGCGIFALGTHRFWKHDLNYKGLRNLAALAMVTQLATIALAVAVSPGLPSNFLTLALPILVIFNLVFYAWIIDRSSTLLRWYAAGQVPQKLRRRFHAGLLQQGKGLQEEIPQSAPVRFAVHADPADQPLAALVSHVLREGGHTEVKDASQAQKQLYILTNRTPRALVEQAGKQNKNDTIFLLGSSVDWCNSLSAAGQTQFVDFRENDPRELKVLAKSLSNLDAWRRQYALEATPKKFEVFDVPTGIQIYRFIGYIQPAFFVGQAVAALLHGAFFNFVFLLALGLGMFMLVERALQRKVMLPLALGVMVGVPVVQAIFNGALLGMTPFLLMVAAIFSTGRYWFPSQLPVAKDAIGMDANGAIKRLGRIIFAAVAIFCAVALTLMGITG